jgi:hypothetical protein
MLQPPALTIDQLIERAEEYRRMAKAMASSSKAKAILINEAAHCERMVAERQRQMPTTTVCCES